MLPSSKTMDSLIKRMHNSRTISQIQDFKIMGMIMGIMGKIVGIDGYQTLPLQRYNQPLQPPQTPQDPYSLSPCDSNNSGWDE